MSSTAITKPAKTHTPGPWVHCAPVPKMRPNHEIRNTEGVTIAYLNGQEGADEVIANARLIAAAPEVTESGRLLLRALVEQNEAAIAFHTEGLRAALAKAKAA